MCCAEFIVKYVLFFANLVFSLGGIALVGIGVALLAQLSDILDLIPININVLPISVIIIGCIIFFIAFFGCCGAIRESRCLLVMYAICMVILAAFKIYIAVVVFRSLATLSETVTGWVTSAFSNQDLRPAFHVLETGFKCCGTTGANSYGDQFVPGSCCGNAIENACNPTDAFDGCADKLSSYFEGWGDASGAIIVTIIIVELIAMIFALFLNQTIVNKRNRAVRVY